MKLTSKPLSVIILVILFGGITFASTIGRWNTESAKQPLTFQEGEFAGQPNPADIRGSYTFSDVEKNFNVPTTTLAMAFGLSGDINTTAFKVKDLETPYADQGVEIGISSVRLFVSLYTGLPYEILDEIYIPSHAVTILKSHGNLTTEQITYLDAHAVALGNLPAPVSSNEEDAHGESTEPTLKDKTTFQEVLDWGVPQGTIENIIGHGIPSPLTRVKDFCLEKGLNFEEIKPAIQAEIDKAAP